MSMGRVKRNKARFFAVLLCLFLLAGLFLGTGTKVYATDDGAVMTETSDSDSLKIKDKGKEATVEETNLEAEDESSKSISDRLATDSEASLETSEANTDVDREAEVDDKRYGFVRISGQGLTESGYYQNNNGVWEKSADNNIPDDHYIHYDRQRHVLTLNNVTITNGNSPILNSGIFVDDTGRNLLEAKEEVYLHIILKGTNTVSGDAGIYMKTDVYWNPYHRAKLKISGPGTLTARGSAGGGSAGIMLQNLDGDVELIVDGANIVAEGHNRYGGYGVYLQHSKTGTGKLTVRGGKLIASSDTSPGIGLFGGSGVKSQGKDRIVVTDSAVVKADGKKGLSFNEDDFSVETGDNGTGGIIFDGKQGTVYGNVTLLEELNIAKGESLTVPKGASLTIPQDKTLANNGTITVEEGGNLTVETDATLDNAGKISVQKGGELNGDVGGTGELAYLPAVATGGTIVADSDEAAIRKVFGNADISVSDKVIALHSNVNLDGSIIFKNGDWTLELGDFTLAGNSGVIPLQVEGGNLTIRGNKGMVRGGDVIDTDERSTFPVWSKGIRVNGGNVRVAGGTVSGGHASGNWLANSVGIDVYQGSVIVTGGRVQGGKLSYIRKDDFKYGESVGIYGAESTVIVTGGIVEADGGDQDDDWYFRCEPIKSEGNLTIAVLGGEIIPKHRVGYGIIGWGVQAGDKLIVAGGLVKENIASIETTVITGGTVDYYSSSSNIVNALWLPDQDRDLIEQYDPFKGNVILPDLTKVRELLKTVGIENFNPYVINKDQKIVISAGESLLIPEGEVLINYGTITVEEGGKLENKGQIHNRGEIKGTITGKQLPQVDNEKLTDATVDKEYSAQLDKNNDSIKWSLKEDSTLPNGLTLDGDTGVISGQPTETGDFTFTLLAQNAGGSEFKTFNIRVNPAIKEEDKPVNYVVTVQTEGKGKAGSNPMIVTSGTKVILNATPDAGYVFKGWELVSGSVKIEDKSFIMPAENVVVKAVFEKEKTAPNKQPNTKVLDKQPNMKVLPKTGEESNIGIWFSLMMASLASFGVLVVSRRTEN